MPHIAQALVGRPAMTVRKRDEVFLIEDAETFKVLADPTRLELVELLLEPQTVTALAERLGVPRTRLYHHVNMLEQSGIIRVAETRQAGAVEERVYEATADMYQPSDAFLASADVALQADAIATSLLGATRADFIRSVKDGVATLQRDPGAPKRIAIRRSLLRLSPERREQFIDDLAEVFDRYADDDESPDAGGVAALVFVHPSSRAQP